MVAPSPLLGAVADRILAAEMTRRVGRFARVDVPADSPPITVLADRVFTPDVLQRRLRFLRAVGWIPDRIGECVPFTTPALPDLATVEDHVAVIAGASSVVADDHATRVLAAAVGAPAGVHVAAADVAWWDATLDRAADRADAGWRGRTVGLTVPWARLEAVTVRDDWMFGRRRRPSMWPAVREAVRWAGETKRRFVG